MNTSFFPKIIAHRGASGSAPENTFASIRKALAMKVDWIEIDVHLSLDGEVVVIHDARLDRTTNGSGPVMAQSLADLQTLDAGKWFGAEFAGERIPGLKQVFQEVGEQAGLLIEIKKGPKGIYAGIEAKILEIMRLFQARDRTILQSFEPQVIDTLHQLDPGHEQHKLVVWHAERLPLHHDGKIRRGSIFEDHRVKAINPWHRYLKASFVKRAQKRGFKVFTYTVNTEKDMRRCIEMGVDGIITNYPEKLNKLKEEYFSSNSPQFSANT